MQGLLSRKDSNVQKNKVASFTYLFLEFVREGKVRNKIFACKDRDSVDMGVGWQSWSVRRGRHHVCRKIGRDPESIKLFKMQEAGDEWSCEKQDEREEKKTKKKEIKRHEAV